jgi:hypothetical protein
MFEKCGYYVDDHLPACVIDPEEKDNIGDFKADDDFDRGAEIYWWLLLLLVMDETLEG